LERRPAIGVSRLLTWSVLEDTEAGDAGTAHIMLAPIAARGEDVDQLTRWLKRRHREREYAENKRLFYVACTRARQELHLFAAPTVSSQGISPGWPDSLLKAAWPAAQPHFAISSSTPHIPITALGDLSDIEELPQEPLEIAANAADIASTQNTESADELPREYQATNENLLPHAYPVIQRLPLTFDPALRFAQAEADRLPYGEPGAIFDRSQFARPEGSFAARSFGNVMHECIDLLTRQIAAGASPSAALAGLATWSSRIGALLRADGLPTALVARLTREILSALRNLLSDPDGQWLLASHPGAATELSLTASDTQATLGQPTSESTPVRPVTVRIDRVFRAGPSPHQAGVDHLWIVDYKSASHGAKDMDVFLAGQSAAYAPQLETYARVVAPAQSIPLDRVRLALYFPALITERRLIWWAIGGGATPESAPATLFDLTTES